MDFGELGLQALSVMAPILLVLLTWVSGMAAKYLKAKIDNQYLEDVMLRLNDTACVVVGELQQTVVDAIKAASADGKIDNFEKKEIKLLAMTHLKSYLGIKGLALLAKVLGLTGAKLDGYLEAKIESAVSKSKKG